MVIDDFDNLWFVEALAGLRAALAATGTSLSVADTRLNAHLGLDPVEVFRSQRVDGIVLAGEASAEAAARSGVPTVVLGTRALADSGGAQDHARDPKPVALSAGDGGSNSPVEAYGLDAEADGPAVLTKSLANEDHARDPESGTPAESSHGEGTAPHLPPVFASDEAAGGRLAVQHLVGLGHREILCVTGPGASAAERERGYREAMSEFGLESRVLRAEATSEAAARVAVAGLFGSGSAPSAVFAVNDPMAVGVIGAARAAGVVCPADLSVVGYDDSPLAAYELVSLTTISGDSRELGEAAGRALVAMIEGADPPRSRSFAPRLVERASTAAVPGIG
ncbi:LacI family DNA-binding transcriptional regulator [Leucobacter viscericola]|uniref:LacI family DNA-binding transcriptional regulator n=1 Tax=Leucobacter viscericola TaxID=2714935 RepID=UPI001FCBCEC0|nr:substrate-binding domain-containing protein [Leucobacter viscericola]